MEVNSLNMATRDMIGTEDSLIDNVFQDDPIIAEFKDRHQAFTGGTEITENLVYAGLPGGAYEKGDSFAGSNVETQTDQKLVFKMKLLQVAIVVNKVDVQVHNKGPKAVYSYLKSKFANAYMTLGAKMAIAQYLPGTGDAAASWKKNIDGFAEIMNDGTILSWNGVAYPTYGELSRAGQPYSNAVQGKIQNLAGAPLTYPILENSYTAACVGSAHPTHGIMTPRLHSAIKFQFQTQQRFDQLQNPKLGFIGLKFNLADLWVSRYCPGSEISGTSDPIATDYATWTTKGQPVPLVAYPTVTNENLFWLNLKDRGSESYMKLYISDDEEYGGGFTGFLPSRDDEYLVGRLKLAWAMTCPGPRYHFQLANVAV
jgi:hypothetical protein